VDNKLYIGNLPGNLPESEVRRLCESFGKLKNFNLVKDSIQPDKSKGFAFFEYVDEKATDKAVRALNGLDFKDKKLKV
jgi:RNA recognition motif-containing protein